MAPSRPSSAEVHGGRAGRRGRGPAAAGNRRRRRPGGDGRSPPAALNPRAGARQRGARRARGHDRLAFGGDAEELAHQLVQPRAAGRLDDLDVVVVDVGRRVALPLAPASRHRYGPVPPGPWRPQAAAWAAAARPAPAARTLDAVHGGSLRPRRHECHMVALAGEPTIAEGRLRTGGTKATAWPGMIALLVARSSVPALITRA